MKTEIREKVINSLLANLIILNKRIRWKIDNPLVLEYISKMDETYRVYHDWEHTYKMVKLLDTLPTNVVECPLLVRSAILFHDIVCVPGDDKNEEHSAEFASNFYTGANITWIYDLILSTKHDFSSPTYVEGDDRGVICDLDLAPLGAPKDIFVQDRINVAREYSCLFSNEEIQEGIQKFFHKVYDRMERDYLFHTSYFRERYEDQARENIKAFLGI